MSFSFWRIRLVDHLSHCVLVVAGFFSQSPFMDVLLSQHFDPIFWPDNQVTDGALHYKGWVSSVLGVVIASWGMLIAFIAYYPFQSTRKMGLECYC